MIEVGTPTGWICPKCGRVMSPTMPFCLYCNAEKREYTSSGTGRTYKVDYLHHDTKTEVKI